MSTTDANSHPSTESPRTTTDSTVKESLSLPYNPVPPPHGPGRRYIFGVYIPSNVLDKRWHELMPAAVKYPSEKSLPNARIVFAMRFPGWASYRHPEIQPTHDCARLCCLKHKRDLPIFPLADTGLPPPYNQPPPLEIVEKVVELCGMTMMFATWWRLESED
ncbi:hypothetical protein E1B28_000165 [Marasmius oreades]|uniref:Uncharacterized protein n=1 Tax=Marasmius oreades TaxID=181124 RepID=A0A9P7V0W6_9AGAR|nr:uncharacterized protein E1B28_000165 [Marasmius oreades]KAG7098197.1 hypothetical protein E1B28_000165 [Marasmius oreades]